MSRDPGIISKLALREILHNWPGFFQMTIGKADYGTVWMLFSVLGAQKTQ